jgi:hypothetical protein
LIHHRPAITQPGILEPLSLSAFLYRWNPQFLD